jgi:glycosyltransferase involved in cell wall biosynthesis
MLKSLSIPMFAIRHKAIGGTEFATYNLIKGLSAIGVSTKLILGRDDHLSPEFREWLAGNPNIGREYRLKLPGPKNVRFLQETLFSLSRQTKEWALFPNYYLPPLKRSFDQPNAVILYDIQYKIHPELHGRLKIEWLDFYLPQMFDRADSVLLISQSEKTLIERFFGKKATDKCDIINIAIDLERFDSASDNSEEWAADLISRPYILSVCHPFPHKNLHTLLSAFQRISPRHPDLFLYLVGQESPANKAFISRNISSEVSRRIKLLGYLPDSKLGLLYRKSEFVAIPSLYEGFGMPSVEALAVGAPILVSGNTSMPEVTLGFGNYVISPKDPNAWIAGIEHMLAKRARPTPEISALVRDAYSPATVARNLLQILNRRGSVP